MSEYADVLSAAEQELFRKREEELWREGTRFNREHMDRVLAPDFVEFGGSGNVHNRDAILSAPRSSIKVQLPLPEFRTRQLTADVVQVTYNSVVEHKGVMQRRRRSSIWTLSASGWVLRFHQGTPYDP